MAQRTAPLRPVAYPVVLAVLAVLALSIGPGCAGAGGDDGGPPGDVVITGGTVIDGTGAPPVQDAVVEVRGNRIVCVGAVADCAVPDDAERIDADGRWVVPGLVDAHVHYSQTGWADGRPDALDVRDRFPYAEAVRWLETNTGTLGRSYLCSGVTATFDVGGYPWTWGLRLSSDTSPGMPHVEAAGPLLSTVDHWVNLPAERQFVYIPTDSVIHTGVDYLAANGTSAVKVWFLVRPQADTAALRAHFETVAAAARAAGLPIIVHATGLWEATVAVENGADLLVHSVEDRPVTDRFLAAAHEAGTRYIPTLTVREGYVELAARRFDPARYGDAIACVDPASLRKARLTDSIPGGLAPDRLAAYRERVDAAGEVMAGNLRRVRDAGIPIAMGTDAGNPLTLHGPAVYPELEAMAAAGLTPMEVLVASTRNAARAMGRHDFGTLEAGQAADLLILDADPLADVAAFRRVVAVMRAGRLYPREELEYR